jgi:hypothetical protein
MFEVRARTPTPRQLRLAVYVSLAISIFAYVAMAVGWIACVVELDRGRNGSSFDTAIMIGLIAAVVALTRGGIHALLMAHFERGDEAMRDLRVRGAEQGVPREASQDSAWGGTDE